MEINTEEIKKKLRIISQNAWKIEGAATSINGIVEWMLLTAFEEIFAPIFVDLTSQLNELQAIFISLEQKLNEELGNVRETRGVPKPTGSKKTYTKANGAEARA